MSPGPGVVMPERAKYRLRIAAAFERARGVQLNVPREQFYPAMAEHLQSLDVDRREWLRGLVDWVEEYDLAEAQGFGRSGAGSR